MSTSYKRYIIPPIFVGLAAYFKGVYGDGFAFDNQMLLLDVLTNAVTYDVALLLSDEVLSRMVSSTGNSGASDPTVATNGFSIIAEPVLQGLANATIPQLGLNKDVINKAASISYDKARKLAPITNETFGSRFLDGVMFNILGTYLSSPLVDD